MAKFKYANWKQEQIRNLVQRVTKPVRVEANHVYREIGIRSHGKGIFHKDEITGRNIGNKRVFWVEPDCFVVNIVFAWEMAVAKTTKSELGMIASHRFPMYKPVKGKLDLDYFLYFFTSPRGKYLLELASPGGAGRNKTLGQEAFLDISIPVPTYEEQRKIAAVLHTWDEAIRLTQDLIAAKQQRKKGLMQRLLSGQVRFPGFEDRPWTMKRLSEIADVTGGKRLPKGRQLSRHDTGHPYIRVSDMYEEGIQTDDLQYVPQDVAPSIKQYRIYKNDLYISVAGTIGLVGLIPNELDGANLTENADRISNIKINNVYLLYILRSPIIQEPIQQQITVNAQPKLALTRIREFKIPVPSEAEQQKIAAVLQACDHEIELLHQKRAALQQQKKGLMQRLLTGQLRVTV